MTARGLARPGAGLAAVGLLATLGCSAGGETEPASVSPSGLPPARCVPEDAAARKFARLEDERDGRVGVHAVDTGTGRTIGHRADERFAYASTIKALSAAVVLDRLSTRDLSRRLRWGESDLVPYSPVTEQHVEDGLTIHEVLDAAVTVSDNTAANLLLDVLGGPQELDRALEEVGDTTTIVVRREP